MLFFFRHLWRRKTLIARLLHGANCETGCFDAACAITVAERAFVDLIEIDAALRTKVKDNRDLLSTSSTPAWSFLKVYLIDEAHMPSRHSFNALS